MASTTLPGAVVIAAIRRVLLWWLVTAFLYPVFMTVLLALGRVMRWPASARR